MPLLKRKAFEKSTVSEYLRDDDEVFHCEITDEIFKDYEEYCERIILVNSMVWTCEMTGKNNLTYAEAQQSEKAARRMLKDFPMELRIPILYLAMRTKRCSFAEMSEDVFNFVRDRYFVGENVEACLEGDQWKQAHVLTVTAPKQHPDNKTMLPSASYVYEVEQFEESDPTLAGQIGIAPFDRVRRRKGVYSRERNRLFLKQFVEHGSAGVIIIKKAALDKYNIHRVTFEQIFTGDPPEFESSKRLLKTSLSPAVAKVQNKPNSANKPNKLKKISPDKKGRQESMDKFVKKTDKAEVGQKPKPPPDPAAKKSAQELVEKMRRAEDQMRQRKEEEKAKKKEKTARLQAYYKEWQKVKDDLELEDHKVIPKGTPVEIEGIPPQYFGDFLSVLEFVHLYADILKAKDVFHNQLDVETFRKALTLKEYAGVLSDLVQMFLTTIFSLQEDEAEDYNESGGIQLSTEDEHMDCEVGVTKAMELATKASKWPVTYLGTPLSKLPLDPTTVSEVLRLHLLSSGSAAGGRCAAWRYQQRGGYTSAEDAGLRLRVRQPHLLRRLASRHVHDLRMDEKFTILQCLMNQILSYATVRDIIEEKLDDWRNTKQALRMLQINERKREAQILASRQELKKEAIAKKEENKLSGEKAREVDDRLKLDIDKLQDENLKKRKEYENKLKELHLGLFDYTSYLGMDRAYRRYFVNQAIAGLFVEAGDESRGPCQEKPMSVTAANAANPEDTMTYVTKLFEAQRERGSDKENDSAANSRANSPKKPLTNLNGLSQKLNGIESNTQQLRELLVCTGDISTCYVHGKGDFRPRWWVYHTEEQIEALIQSLNKRGLRESDLRQALELDKANIIEYLKRCPLHMLNPAAASHAQVHWQTRRDQWSPSLRVPHDSSVSEALELALRDHILELEEKIFHGCLGTLKVKDREAWRGTIMLRGYDKQADYLTWGPNSQYRDDYHMPNGVLNVPDDVKDLDLKSIPENKYRDPGHYLENPRVNGVKVKLEREEDEEEMALQATVVRGLASALLQVEQAIHHKYLKRPLGVDKKERKLLEAKNKPIELEALERWEVSLMECGGFGQLGLHLLALDSSVAWAASVLNASCRLCRRRTDPDNMLLCDGCNKGHHLYCLKPKLNKVPEGDWYCDQCRPKEPKTPRRKRKLFMDEDIINELNSEDDESSVRLGVSVGVCAACGSGGELASACASCARRFHAECAAPRPARASKRWQCHHCLNPQRETRRCAATALSNIHQYTKALHQRINSSESDDSDYNTTLTKVKGKRGKASVETLPSPNGQYSGKKRGRKPKQEQNSTSSRRSKNSLTNGNHEEQHTLSRQQQKRGRESNTLHTESMHQLIKEAMKHKDCWPFYEPVSVEDVPDYHDIIEHPMDFTTIKMKLADGEYANDEEFINDVALVFNNCYTYNSDTHPVAKAGCRLEKYIKRRCPELDLPELPTLEGEEFEADGEQWDSPKRTFSSSAEEEDGPKVKRARLN